MNPHVNEYYKLYDDTAIAVICREAFISLDYRMFFFYEKLQPPAPYNNRESIVAEIKIESGSTNIKVYQ